jgi:hypothetical protein
MRFVSALSMRIDEFERGREFVLLVEDELDAPLNSP